MADDVGTRLEDWEARLDRLEENEVSAAGPRADGRYILFVPAPSGYQLVERSGSAPAAGDVLELDERDGRYLVSRSSRSPLPDDARRCFYLALT